MPSGLAAYEVACGCGEVARGPRLQPRTIRCPRCGEDLFVLPLSPLPPVTEGSGAGQRRPAAPAAVAAARRCGTRHRCRIGPAVPLSNRPVYERHTSRRPASSPPVHLAERLEAAHAHLGLGHFHLAVEELQRARRSGAADRSGSKRSGALALLLAQASLMADLLSESLKKSSRTPPRCRTASGSRSSAGATAAGPSCSTWRYARWKRGGSSTTGGCRLRGEGASWS